MYYLCNKKIYLNKNKGVSSSIKTFSLLYSTVSFLKAI